MKKFEKPVVALNEMMMSESIASICCYAVTTTGDAWGVSTTIKTVLNGGYIGSTGGSHYSLTDKVVNFLGGVIPAPQVHYSYFQYTEPDEDHYASSDSGPTGASYGKAAGFYTEHKGVLRYSRNGSELTYVAWYDKSKGDVINVAGVDGIPDINTNYDYVNPTSGAQICAHDNKDCPWVKEYNTTSGDMHIGATQPHATGGVKWWEPHKAQQYAS
ncbi:MAG: hypothetical protein LBB86_10545 [Oscillospiraceae bacterium]|nr:hypothetical protein [Oscillospiraceae bacterium]